MGLYEAQHTLVAQDNNQNTMKKPLFIFALLMTALMMLPFEVQACSKKVLVRRGMDMEKVFASDNKQYIIEQDFDLEGKTVKIGKGCTLVFQGGSLANGTVIGNNTEVKAANYEIFRSGTRKYRGYYTKWYGYVASTANTLTVAGTWSNTRCGDRWTGMNQYSSSECSSLALNNYILLHKKGMKVTFPANSIYYCYGKIDCSGYPVDFSGSTIVSIDFNKVEDKSLALPKDAKISQLRSIYGLVFFEGDGGTLENLIIDGRASSRNEEATLGSECLIAMGNNHKAIIKNVVLKDAVGCGICTNAIHDCVFENVQVLKCGEHGIYTHAYKGNITFKNCRFNNCGQSPALYKQRGQSSCVRFAGTRDHNAEELKTLKAYFTNCSFVSTGDLQVATTYSDLPYAEFRSCVWDGVGGYTVSSAELAEKIGKLIEYRFYDCINPCAKINSVNTIRRLYNCKEVRNPFADAVEVVDCEIITCYADVENRYSDMFSDEIERNLIFKNCRFYKDGSDVSVRNTVRNPRSVVFERCTWDFKPTSSSKNKGTYFLVQDDNGQKRSKTKTIQFKNCSIDIDQYRLLYCSDTDVMLDKTPVTTIYQSYVGSPQDKSNRITIK